MGKCAFGVVLSLLVCAVATAESDSEPAGKEAPSGDCQGCQESQSCWFGRLLGITAQGAEAPLGIDFDVEILPCGNGQTLVIRSKECCDVATASRDQGAQCACATGVATCKEACAGACATANKTACNVCSNVCSNESSCPTACQPCPPCPSNPFVSGYVATPSGSYCPVTTPACGGAVCNACPSYPVYQSACGCAPNNVASPGCPDGCCQGGAGELAKQLHEAHLQLAVLQATAEAQTELAVIKTMAAAQEASRERERELIEGLVEAQVANARLEGRLESAEQVLAMQQELAKVHVQLAESRSAAQLHGASEAQVRQVLAENAQLKKLVADLKEMVKTRQASRNDRPVVR